jgi:hypothetical protein
MNALLMSFFGLALLSTSKQTPSIRVDDPNIVYSPYNWVHDGKTYAQSSNPGAYFKLSFNGTRIGIDLDVSPLTAANVPASQYPVIRYSVDGKPGTQVQLTPNTEFLKCADGLPSGSHSLLLQYVSGYVFLDFWTPVNTVRITGFTLDPGSSSLPPTGFAKPHSLNALFLGDSITNGDDDIAEFSKGITNAVDTQDATIGYPAIVAAGLGAEYGIAAYGGASWDGNAADGHTPGLMTSFSMIDQVHSRLVSGKLSPIPDEIFINMGENAGPSGDDVPKLLTELRKASSPKTHINVIVPFSGRARSGLKAGFEAYRKAAGKDKLTYLLDLGNNPYLAAAGPTLYSVDGQHPLANLHALLGAQILGERAKQLALKH